MNAMAFDVMIPFRDRLREIGSDNDIRVVVMTGAGHGFCSGADLEDPGTIPNVDGLTLPTLALRSMELLDDVISTIRRLHQPVIAAINGPAIGGGFCLALSADIRIAADVRVFSGRRHQQRSDGGRARDQLPPSPQRRAVASVGDHAHRSRRVRRGG